MNARRHPTMSRFFLLVAATMIAGTTAFVRPSIAEDAADGTAKPMGPGGPNGRSKPPSAKSAPAGITVARSTPISASVNVHDKTLEQCNLQTMLPQLISEKNADVQLSDKHGATHLDLRIVDIHAPSGGVFSGPKWVTVEGKLMAGKTVKGDFVAKETSMGSATACGMLSKVMAALAGDIAEWVRSPAKDARLGGAR
jgi:hypothetical protein